MWEKVIYNPVFLSPNDLELAVGSRFQNQAYGAESGLAYD